MELQEVGLLGDDHKLHNYYGEFESFFRREKMGHLVDRYKQRAALVTEDLMVGFQLALEDELGDAAGEIMYRCGFEWGKKDMSRFSTRMEEEFGRKTEDMLLGMVLETWWWPLQAAGWGSWAYDLSHRSEGLVFVNLYNSAVAQTIGAVGNVVCHYYAGMFAGVFSHFAKRDLGGIEIQCYAMGEEYCKFLVGSSKRINAAQFWVREGATADEVISRL